MVFRTFAIYFVLLVLFRLVGKRSLAQITTFDFVLLLIISEAIQQGLLGSDFSVTNALIIVTTFLILDVGLSLLKGHLPALEKYVDGVPLIIVENGEPLKDRMNKARVDESDVLQKARELQGLERMDQIKYAVLERSGGITIIPKQSEK